MNPEKGRILLLALGNDLLGDDGVGLWVARALAAEFGSQVDVIETSEAGLALMEIMTGYERVLLIDAVVTGKHPIGSVVEFTRDDFQKVIAPSPHYAGIPEVFAVASRLSIPMPSEIRILALEVENPFEFQEELTPLVKEALPEFVDCAGQVLRGWIGP